MQNCLKTWLRMGYYDSEAVMREAIMREVIMREAANRESEKL